MEIKYEIPFCKDGYYICFPLGQKQWCPTQESLLAQLQSTESYIEFITVDTAKERMHDALQRRQLQIPKGSLLDETGVE